MVCLIFLFIKCLGLLITNSCEFVKKNNAGAVFLSYKQRSINNAIAINIGSWYGS